MEIRPLRRRRAEHAIRTVGAGSHPARTRTPHRGAPGAEHREDRVGVVHAAPEIAARRAELRPHRGVDREVGVEQSVVPRGASASAGRLLQRAVRPSAFPRSQGQARGPDPGPRVTDASAAPGDAPGRTPGDSSSCSEHLGTSVGSLTYFFAPAVSCSCSSCASSAVTRPIATRSSGLMKPSESRNPPARAIASRRGTAQ